MIATDGMGRNNSISITEHIVQGPKITERNAQCHTDRRGDEISRQESSQRDQEDAQPTAPEMTN